MKCIHIKRHIVHLAFIVCYRAVRITVKCCKLSNVVPHIFITCVENMCPILMHLDSFHLFCINVSTDMRTPLYDETALSCLHSLMGKDCSIKPSPYNNIIVHNPSCSLLSSIYAFSTPFMPFKFHLLREECILHYAFLPGYSFHSY